MSELAARELRNHTAAVLARVGQGESLTITLRGRPVARLESVRSERPVSIPRAELLSIVENRSADPGLRNDLAELVGDTTDDLDLA